LPLQQSPGGIGLPCGTSSDAEKTTDALIQLWADDVLELARLVVQLGIFDGESILE